MMTEAIQKFALERPRKVAKGQFPWASCAPFVENSRGTLIHRPRSGSTYNLHRTGPHVGIHFWCGMATSSDGKNLTFLAFPPEGRVLCERCEVAAVINGLPSADELAGRHVHKGRTIAIDEETARLYAGKCCFCKFFRDAYIRTDEHPWVDNPGWCVRYPPVFVGGEEDKGEEVDYSRFKQPGVVGGDECGEFLQAEAPNRTDEVTCTGEKK